jgi:hypothetical protein
MPWIESHQSLARHRKTLEAVALLRVDRHKLIGHLHELWWWGLDNADSSGMVGHAPPEALAAAAGWPLRDANRFVEALRTAGFLDQTEDGYVLHDWYDYAGRMIQKRAANKQRMQDARAANVQRTNDARAGATVPDLPDRTVPLNPLSAQTAAHEASGANGAAPHADATPHQDDESPPQTLRPGMAICPQCRLPFSGQYIDHTAEKHKVNPSASPGNLGSKLRRDSEPEPPPPDVAAQFAAMHQRLQDLEQQTEVKSC